MNRRLLAALSLGLAVVTVGWLLPGLEDVGLTWDEPHYFASADQIQDWTVRVIRGQNRAEMLSAETIRETWDAFHYWNPHPPVYKELMAVTEGLFGPFLGSLIGFRMVPLLAFALLVAALVWTAGLTAGPVAGVGAGLSLMLMPRVVGHAHIAATDMPLTLFWFVATMGLVLYVFERRRGWLVLGAVALGLAMGTKFTGYLVPIPLLAWLPLFVRRRKAAVAVVAWGAAGAILAFALNPIAWHDPLRYYMQLASESLRREELVPISTRYLGQTYLYRVPWHHPLVMTAATLPVSLIALSVVGATQLRRWRERPLLLLAFNQIGFFLVLMALPSSPNHDGIRLWLPMFPWLALVAGVGLERLVAALRERLPGRAGALGGILVGCLFFYPAYLQLTRVAPYYLAYYGELIGRESGAARAGMETSYWFDAYTPSFLQRVNDVLPEGATLLGYPHPGHLRHLQLYGQLRQDLSIVNEWPTEYLLLLARQASFEPVHRGLYENVVPVVAVELDGVELAGLYRWSESEANTGPAEAP